ncbi:MAG: WecB/TagA/CpsF family glycosyltransferase [Aggregatilineales bacterium]
MPLARLLCVKISDIGDLITATPALSALRQALPQARVDVLTSAHAAPILNGTGLADQVLIFPLRAYERLTDVVKPAALHALVAFIGRLRAQRYDAVLLFHQLSTRFGALKHAVMVLGTGAPIRAGLQNGRGWFLTHSVPDHGFGAFHQADYWLKVAALLSVPDAPERFPLRVGISEADRAWAAERLPESGYVAVHSGSGALNVARRWTAAGYAAAAVHFARLHGTQIVLVGGAGDETEALRALLQVPYHDLVGQTTLGQLAAVLERCAVFIGGDSGVMHLAAAIPRLALYTPFGPTNPFAWSAWRPSSQQAVIVRSGALCSPCAYIGQSVGLRSGCAARTCMRSITPEALIRGESRLEIAQRARRPALEVLGVPIDGLTFAELLDQIGAWVREAVAARLICTANPELVMLAQRDVLFYTILRRAALVTADGVGLLWAARRLGSPLPERVTGSDGLLLIAERAAREGWRLFLLGAAEGVAARAAEKLQERFPTLCIAGTHSGKPSPECEDEIVALINRAQADILFVAYGSPQQEKWLARNLARLEVKVALGVGGAFDFVAGTAQRAPLWIRRIGLEWLHRLIRQPWRLRRMASRLPRFVIAVLLRGSRAPRAFEGIGGRYG